MLSINMRIFKTVLLFVGLGSNVLCSPLTPDPTTSAAEISASTAEVSTSTTEVSTSSAEISTSTAETSTPATSTTGPMGDHYDQRQNGTENYNIHVDGVILVVAPVEALLLAGAADPNFSALSQNGLDVSKPGSAYAKPKPEVDGPSRPAAAPKSGHRPNVRLINILGPLLRRFRQE